MRIRRHFFGAFVILGLLVSGLACPLWAQSADDLLEQAHRLFSQGKYQACVEACARAVAEDPGLSEAYRRRGSARRQLGHDEGALADHHAALSADPTNAKA